MNRQKAGFSEQAVNKVVALAIASQLRQAVDVEVQIKTDLSKIMKGRLDSMGIKIRGLLMQQNLEAEELHLQIGEIQVKVSSALRGKIVLLQPSEGTLRLVINEDIITSALNTKAIYSTLNTQKEVDIETPDIEQMITCSLSENRILIDVLFPTSGGDDRRRSQLAIIPEISANQEEIDLSNLQLLQGEQLTQEFTNALLAGMREILSLREFAQKGTWLKIQAIETVAGRLTLDSAAYIEYFPD